MCWKAEVRKEEIKSNFRLWVFVFIWSLISESHPPLFETTSNEWCYKDLHQFSFYAGGATWRQRTSYNVNVHEYSQCTDHDILSKLKGSSDELSGAFVDRFSSHLTRTWSFTSLRPITFMYLIYFPSHTPSYHSIHSSNPEIIWRNMQNILQPCATPSLLSLKSIKT